MLIHDLWNDEAARDLDTVSSLRYRSNLLGADRRVANWGGGNTSSKAAVTDFKGEAQQTLYVKGSGSDLATITERGFTPLRLVDVLPLLERASMSDQEMVDYLSHCVTGPGFPRASIETLLHAFLPFKEVDHTHPDAIIALCCAQGGREIAERLYGGEAIWIPYQRPGFALAKEVALAVRDNPQARLVLLGKHGLITWGDTSEEAYRNTLWAIRRAEDYFAGQMEGKAPLGGQRVEPLSAATRDELLFTVLPAVRGMVSQGKRMILRYDDSPEVMEFVCASDSRRLSQVGAACPDHLVHTKRTPLFADFTPGESADVLVGRLREQMAEYVSAYRRYQERYRDPGDPEGDPYPRVLLIPGVGMITTGKSDEMADVSAQLYQRAIEVMKRTAAVDEFVSLTEAEAYAVEYWPLELYKMTLAPPEREFSRRVVFVTGGAGGIGKSSAERFLQDGAHVVIADLNAEGAQTAAAEAQVRHGAGRCFAVELDVTSEDSVRKAYEQTVRRYGGVDIVVSNAGISTSHPVDETTLDEWQLNINVLATGYFLVSRTAVSLFKQQGVGGNLVFVVSKNGLYAGKNVAAYSASKAAELHLARCLAEEGGAYGIRVNSVCPDAVLQGSAIWTSEWKEERASNYGIAVDELEGFYRDRTTLKVSVFPEDVAEAIAYFASSRAAKTTGCILTVDGGVVGAYTR